jgi:hypothetical protein
MPWAISAQVAVMNCARSERLSRTVEHDQEIRSRAEVAEKLRWSRKHKKTVPIIFSRKSKMHGSMTVIMQTEPFTSARSDENVSARGPRMF